MDTRARIKLLSLLLCLFSFANLLFIDYSKAILAQMVFHVPVIIAVLSIIYFFYKGKNWARILVMAGSIFSLLFLALPFTWNFGLTQRIVIVLDGALSVYLVIFLNTGTAKAYFPKAVDAAPAAPKHRTWIIIGSVVAGFLFLLVAGVIALVSRVSSAAGNMQVCLEDIKTGTVQYLTNDGLNLQPAFSPDGEKIVFVHRDTRDGKKAASELRILSLKDGSVTTALRDEDLILSPSWGPDSSAIIYVSKQGDRSDIWLLDLRDKSRKQITHDGQAKKDPQLSPDGKLVLLLQKAKKEGIEEIFILPMDGGEKTQLTNTPNFLKVPQSPVWSADSNSIVYASFLSLVFANLKDQTMRSIDLIGLGLNSPDEIIVDPADDDTILLKARRGREFSTNLYRLSRKEGTCKIVRKSSLFEMGYRLSPDGQKLLYEKPKKK